MKLIIQKLKSFFSIRALLILIIIIGAAFTYTYILKYRKESDKIKAEERDLVELRSKIDSAAIAKSWDTDSIPQENIKSCYLKTKYLNGKLKYKLLVNFGDKFNHLRFEIFENPFDIKFESSDSFELLTIKLYSHQQTNIVDMMGKKMGVEYNGEIEVKLAEYLAFKEWNLLWKF